MSERPASPSISLSERLDLKYWAFRTLAAVVPLTPLWLARRLAVGVGALAWLFAGSLRRRAERNLGHVPALADDPARLRRAARGVFITLALNYLDFFRGRFVTYEELARGWDIRGWDIFERAMAGGRGAIVLGAHIGPFEYSAWKLGELGYPLLTPAERLRPERFNQLVSHLRNHHQARLLPGDDRETLRELLTSLRDGQMAMFAIDRWVMGPSDAWPLFGAAARMPTAPFALAARSDAPVFLLVPWRVDFNHIEAAVELITPERMPADERDDSSDAAPADATPDRSPRAPGPRGRDRDAAIARLRRRVYPVLERYISAHPDQWVSALSSVWEFAEDTQAAQAPAEQRAENEAENKAESGEEARPARAIAQREPAQTVAGDNG